MTTEEKIELHLLKQKYSALETRIGELESKENKEYVTPKELAQILGCSLNHIYIKIRQGKIKTVSIGRSYRIPMNQFQNPTEKLKQKIFQ